MSFHRAMLWATLSVAAAAFAPIAAAQALAVSSLQSGLVGAGPVNGAAITSGTNISGFSLYINGTFPQGQGVSEAALWTDANNVVTHLQLVTASSTLILAFVPASLFASPGSATVTVVRTVVGLGSQTSNGAAFTVNPQMTATGSLLPVASVNSAYSASFFTGGTGPFSAEVNTALPPGMNVPYGGNPFAGTPTAAGIYQLEFLVTDSWQNQADLIETFVANYPATVTSISPFQALAGSSPVTLTVNGANFVSTTTIVNVPSPIPGSVVEWGTGTFAVPLATTYVSPTQLTAIIPANLLATVGVYPVSVMQPSGTFSNTASFTVASPIQPLQIQVPGGSSATISALYDLRPTASGGTPPYAWAASGLPSGLSINRSTGEISGYPSQTGSFPVVLTVTDSTPSNAPIAARATFTIVVTSPPPPPLQFSGSTLPSGTVGLQYAATLYASGGSGNPYTYSLSSGALPAGLTLTAGGSLYGIPTAAGAFNFGVQAADASGATATAAFSIAINPATLTITGAVSPVTVGATVNVKFGATGGTPPYTFSLGGTTAPPGTQLGSDGTLSGTVTTAGSFTFRVTVTDSAKNTATQSFTLQVNPAPLTITTTTPLPNGQVGVAYSLQFTATGGTPPYTWSAVSVPPGLSLSAAGVLAGKPTSAAPAFPSVTVTDAAGSHATTGFSLIVVAAPIPLTVVEHSLPQGSVGAQYTTQIAATGGTPPYTWAFTGLPGGLTANSSGAISGSPSVAGTFTLNATVTDSAGATAIGAFSITVAGALVLSSTTLPNATLGAAYSASLAASGGVAPYTFAVTGLPAGITATAAGALSGTPTAIGSFPLSVTVKDSSQLTATASVSLTVSLPVAPALNFTGAPPTTAAASQNTVQIGLASTYPVAITAKLTLTFTPTSGADDPAVQFASGGRTTNVTIPAGSTVASASVGVQAGTVAGTITITAQLLAGTTDITPAPAPKQVITINAAAPVITSVTAARNSTGFTVTIVGYATTRSVTQALFQFTAASGSTLQSSSATVSTDSTFSGWFTSSAAAAYGGQFTLTQPFTVTGSPQGIASVTVTLVNALGNSNTVSATLQ